MSEQEEITIEDSVMLLKLIASLNRTSYGEEFGWETMMSSLDQLYILGADISIMFGHSVIVNFELEYFDKVQVHDNLADSIFEAMQNFSKWYLKHKTNGE